MYNVQQGTSGRPPTSTDPQTEPEGEVVLLRYKHNSRAAPCTRQQYRKYACAFCTYVGAGHGEPDRGLFLGQSASADDRATGGSSGTKDKQTVVVEAVETRRAPVVESVATPSDITRVQSESKNSQNSTSRDNESAPATSGAAQVSTSRKQTVSASNVEQQDFPVNLLPVRLQQMTKRLVPPGVTHRRAHRERQRAPLWCAPSLSRPLADPCSWRHVLLRQAMTGRQRGR